MNLLLAALVAPSPTAAHTRLRLSAKRPSNTSNNYYKTPEMHGSGSDRCVVDCVTDGHVIHDHVTEQDVLRARDQRLEPSLMFHACRVALDS